MKPSTRLVRPSRASSVSPPLDRSTTFAYSDGEVGDFFYQRYAHPTGLEAERLLGELEGGHALLFPSGSGAATALVLTVLRPGDRVALAAGAYYGTSVLFRLLGGWGLEYEEFDQRGAPPERVQLVWVEAPANPFLTFPDLEAAADHPAPLVVDSTASTPLLLRPLEHGADFVLHSATKYLAGHSDALLGVVVCAREEDADRLREVRSRTGIVAAPDAAWLLLRGLRTLDVRVERQSATALELARRLRRAALVRRRRRRARRRARDAPDHERDLARRSRVADRDAGAVGRRPRPREPRPPRGRPRGRGRPLGRPHRSPGTRMISAPASEG